MIFSLYKIYLVIYYYLIFVKIIYDTMLIVITKYFKRINMKTITVSTILLITLTISGCSMAQKDCHSKCNSKCNSEKCKSEKCNAKTSDMNQSKCQTKCSSSKCKS